MGSFPDGVYRAQFPYYYRNPEGMPQEAALDYYLNSIKDVFEQCGPGAAADSGRRCGRPDGAGGDRGRNRSDAPHSETASERGLKLLIVTGL